MADLWQAERRGATAVLLYRNPPSNLFGRETLGLLDGILDECAVDPGIRVVIMTSGLPNVFGAGLDLRELPRDEAALRAMLHVGGLVSRRIETFPKPILAAIEGACFGGAFELALSCHCRIASVTARFAQPEVIYGIIPAGGATQRLPRLVGRGQGLRWLLTGATLKAEEAVRIGVVDVLTPEGCALTEAHKLAKRIARMDPQLTRTIIDVVDRGAGMTLGDAITLEQSAFMKLMTSPERPLPAQGVPERARAMAGDLR